MAPDTSDQQVRRLTVFLHAVGGAGLGLLASSGSLKASSAFSWLPFDLTLVTTALVALVVSVHCVKGILGRSDPRIVVAPVVLWLVFAVPLLWSPVTEHAAQKSILLFTVTLACAVGPLASFTTNTGRLAFIWSLAAVAALTSVAALVGPEIYANEYTNRVTLDGATTITTARMVGAGALLSFLGIFAPVSRVWRVVFGMAFPLLLIVGLSTGSRGPLISVGIAVVVTLVLAKHLRHRRVQGLIIAVMMVGIGVFEALRDGSDGVERVLSFLAGDDAGGGSGRDRLYINAIDSVLERPLGVGWGGYSYYNHTYPHNLILETAVEAGVVVALLLCLYLSVAFIVLLRSSHSFMGACFLGLYIFAFFNAMVSSDINGNRLLWIMVFGAFALSRSVPATGAGTPDAILPGTWAPIGAKKESNHGRP